MPAIKRTGGSSHMRIYTSTYHSLPLFITSDLPHTSWRAMFPALSCRAREWMSPTVLLLVVVLLLVIAVFDTTIADGEIVRHDIPVLAIRDLCSRSDV